MIRSIFIYTKFEQEMKLSLTSLAKNQNLDILIVESQIGSKSGKTGSFLHKFMLLAYLLKKSCTSRTTIFILTIWSIHSHLFFTKIYWIEKLAN